MPYSAIKVANRFLELAHQSVPKQPVTPLQLIKLVYIANGWSLAYLDRPLVNEAAEAWMYGPVIPELYRAVRHFRASPIDGLLPDDYDVAVISDEDSELIRRVWEAYGKLSGTQLSNLTHQPGTPWSLTWRDGAGQNCYISTDLVSKHYRKLKETA